MVIIEKIDESWINLQGEYDEILTISNHFTFMAPNYRWSPKFKAGVWDGKIRLMQRNGNLPIGLYPRLKTLLKQLNIQYENNFKKTSIKLSKEQLNAFIDKEIKSDIKIRDYQEQAVIAAFHDQKCVVLSPTASGKSYIQFLIAMMNLKLYSDSKILIIVPTVGLVEQMRGDFIDYSNNIDCPSIGTIYSGKEKVNYSNIIISTWQSLNIIQDKEFFESFTTVVVDEVHSAANAKVIQSVIQRCTNARMKIGVSGTIQDERISQIQLEGLFGRTHNFVSTKELMDKGTLSNLKIEFLVLKYNNKYRKECHKLEYPNEMKFLRNNPERLNFITNMTKKINKNVLILFRNRDYGEAIYERLESMNLGRNLNLVYGSTKAEVREEVRKLAIDDKNGIIVASVGVFSTGINIPSLDYVIFGQTQKSKIKVLQSIGRVLRKRKGKTKAVLIDIVDDLVWKRKQNYSMKHGMDRMEIYDKEGFNYDIKEVNLN